MRNLKLIIVREYLARVRNKTFMIMTFLSPIIMVGMVILIAYLSSLNSDENKIIAVYDESDNAFFNEFKSDENISYLDYSDMSLEAAIDSVAKKEYYGLLFFPNSTDNQYLAKHTEFFANKAPGISFLSDIESKISTVLTEKELQRRGVNLNEINQAKTKVNLQIENFSGEETSKLSNYVKMFFGGAAGYLLMMFIIIYGNMVMRSVIEEKTNRIIEIIISSVKPMQLMVGKILGTSLAGITQFAIWIVFGSILLFVVTSIFGIDISNSSPVASTALDMGTQDEIGKLIIDIVHLPLGKIVFCFLIYFIGGYFLYSSLYAAIGAAVDSETDTQQFMLPIILPLMLGIYVGFFSVIDNPHGTISTIFSYIPLTSPVVMLMRIPFGVAWWEIVLSMAILICTIFLLIWVAAKIYRVGILMYGKKPSYKELYKWLRY
ncbi:ABC-2 type transport system permease protein [Mesonia phycicola]|uniref:ABC-2 type transport system permease protein n=1 Tax=Mesonia phycicola TaxID=579105 RepID=A0A1M6AQQ5_9FLAO|nr:ABC transporter permease [Mesonia phycicola]SHI38761.1 ABC-2 type transport system permease protein [Mesonia phycicola]